MTSLSGIRFGALRGMPTFTPGTNKFRASLQDTGNTKSYGDYKVIAYAPFRDPEDGLLPYKAIFTGTARGSKLPKYTVKIDDKGKLVEPEEFSSDVTPPAELAELIDDARALQTVLTFKLDELAQAAKAPDVAFVKPSTTYLKPGESNS